MNQSPERLLDSLPNPKLKSSTKENRHRVVIRIVVERTQACWILKPCPDVDDAPVSQR